MNKILKNTKLFLMAVMLLILTAGFAAAQERLKNGAAVSSVIGGESHTDYYIRARKGQTITVVVTRRVAKDGNFNLSVTRGAGGREVRGTETNGRRQLIWTGKAPATANYHFDMTAYPTTRFKLRVTVK